MLAHLPTKRAEDEEASLEAQLDPKTAKPTPRNQQLDSRSNELFFSSR